MRIFKQYYKNKHGTALTTKWYGELRDLNGRLRKIPLSTNRRDSERALAALDEALEAARCRSSISVRRVPPLVREALFRFLNEADHPAASLEHSMRPLALHFADWAASLRHRGNTSEYVAKQISRAQGLLLGFEHWSDVTPGAIIERMDELRAQGIAPQTLNKYLQASKQFARWMEREGRVERNPLRYILRTKTTGKSRVRRPLTDPEVEVLISTTEKAGPRAGMTGPERALLYRTALLTGLRSSELRSLLRSDLSLDANPPTMTLQAAYSKRRRTDIIPLVPDLVEHLRKGMKTSPPDSRVFGFKRADYLNTVFRADLEAAGIPYRDGSGRVSDFHSLRHTFITNLARGGTHPKVTQELARHCTIDLTMQHYTHTVLGDHLKALERLPRVGTPPGEGTEPKRKSG